MKENKIGGIPVTDAKGVLIGIVTNRDLRFEKDFSLPIKKIMTTDNIITTEISDLENAEQILQENNQQAPMILRVNTRRQTREDYLSLLETQKISTNTQPHPLPP